MASTGTVNCPHCGESISRNAAACPHCGSDERTGWSESAYLDGIDLGDDIDYEDVRDREFSGEKRAKFPVWQVTVALLLLVLFVIGIINSVV